MADTVTWLCQVRESFVHSQSHARTHQLPTPQHTGGGGGGGGGDGRRGRQFQRRGVPRPDRPLPVQRREEARRRRHRHLRRHFRGALVPHDPRGKA
ncbi:hypothetical protein ACQJBY_010919 [Aegilops geniculata]